MKKHRQKGNPYFISYLGLAMLSCIILSVLFLSINLENTRHRETLYTQEKLCLIAEDLEHQLESFEKINLLISVDKLYQPFYFTRNKYYELTLLNDFTQYRNYSPLITEYFLYYQNYDTIFHSDEYTTDLNTYLSDLTDDDCLQLTRMLNTTNQTSFFYSSKALFVLMPLSIHTSDLSNAVLCLVITPEALRQRFQTVSGGLDGTISLYADTQLLYEGSTVPSDYETDGENFSFSDAANSDSNENSSQEKLFSYQVPGGVFTVSYRSSNHDTFTSALFPLQILLVIAVIILVLFTASLFAYHSYKPLLLLTQKYQKTLPFIQPETPFDNKLEELNYMMESILKKNITANIKLEEYQELLRSQLLLLLLNGKYSFDITPYLSQVRLNFPGPYYFVICTIFSKEENPEPAVYKQIRDLYQSLSDQEEQKYVYSVIDTDQRIISSLISITDVSQKQELFNDFKGLSESFSPLSRLGYGNITTDLGSLSASYLEALDTAKTITSFEKEEEKNTAFQVRPSDLYPVISALSNGNEAVALQAMTSYLSAMEQKMPSLLMQQYLFTCFLNELLRIAHEHQIELSKQSISRMIAAKDPKQFSSAVSMSIHEFCTKFQEQKSRLSQDKSYQIFQYMNDHFTDYELSIEYIAAEFQTNTAFVRNSIQQHTGKNYKDYLIYLRMEYAKKLLVNDHLTVAQTCQAVGYTNISYFIKAFKSQTGVTPANYKNNL